MMTSERAATICGRIQEGNASDDEVHELADYCTRGLQVLLEGGTLIEVERQRLLASTAMMLTGLTVRHLQHVHKVTFGMPPGFERIDNRARVAAAAMVGLQLADLGDRAGLERSLQEAMQHVLTEANVKAPFAKAVIEQLYSGPLVAMVGLDILTAGLELEAAEAGVDSTAVREYFKRHVRLAVVEHDDAGAGLVDAGGRRL